MKQHESTQPPTLRVLPPTIEVTALIGVPNGTVCKWLRTRRIPAHRLPDRSYRFYKTADGERHYIPRQVFGRRGLSEIKIRRMFEAEPSVLRIGEPSRRVGRKVKRFLLHDAHSRERRVRDTGG
jgi:excisionase family DNA binding protein